MAHFLEALHSGRVLLMDGAMGTELQRAGIAEAEYGDIWTLTHPDRVRAIHQAYVDVGAEVLLTNTFQIILASLDWGWRTGPSSLYGDGTCALTALQWSAYALCRSAGGPNAFVLGDIGSFFNKSAGTEFSDFSMLKRAAARVGLVDAVLLETCSTPRVQLALRRVIGSGTGVPVLLSLTYRRSDAGRIETSSGHAPEWFAERAAAWGVAALGVNCGRDLGMEEVIEIVHRYRQVTDLPLFARPNAGTPRLAGKRWVYPHTPKKLAARLPELLEAGVCMVGGCCGTTPEHIAAFRPIVEDWNRAHSARQGRKPSPPR